jgi:energy-coupling factor transport system substrate-specific component
MYYQAWSGPWQGWYAVLVTSSSAVVAGVGSWLLVRALARTGVLAAFPSGADQARV